MSRFSEGKLSYYVGLCCQYVLAIIFALAIIGKIMDTETSKEFISAVLKTNDTVTGLILLATIITEAILCLGLLLYGNEKWPYYSTAGVLGAFTLLIAYGMYIDLQALCGCFGSVIEATTVNSAGLLRNTALVIAAVLAPGLKKQN